jgi:hypothetical protein
MKKIKLLFILLFVVISFSSFSFQVEALEEITDINIDNVKISPHFDKNTYEYLALIDNSTFDTNINIVSSSNVYVLGDGKVILNDEQTYEIIVMNNNGDVVVYTFKALFNVAKIDNIEFKNIDFTFDSNIFSYDIKVPFSLKTLEPNITLNNNTTYQINTNSLIVGDNKVIVTALENGKKNGEYIFNIKREEAPRNYFDLTNKEETFVVPYTGNYKLEVWGASGNIVEGKSYLKTGYGGYSVGEVYLEKGTVLYINVGGKGTSVIAAKMAGGYNGGGNAYDYSDGRGAGSGGGATHIALSSGLLKDLANKKEDVLIVAGGGGGLGNHNNVYTYSLIAGSGGGASGVTGYSQGTSSSSHYYGYGGTQTAAGSSTNPGGSRGGFGFGGNCNNTNNCSGGGGGWYGGGYNTNWSGAGGGGSGYIGNTSLTNKEMYCYNCTASTDISIKTTSVTNVSDKPISSYAKKGDGYALITYLDKESGLDNIILNDGEIPLDFDKDTFTYNVIVDDEVDSIKIDANSLDEDASILGTGTFGIISKTNNYEIVFTSLTGSIKVYNINVTRTPNSYKYLSGIKINGILLEDFVYDKNSYDIEIPSIFDKINIEAIPGALEQTITGDGIVDFKDNSLIVDILVVSEDNNETSSYRLNFTREKSTKLRSLSVEGGTYVINGFSSNKYEYELKILDNTLELPLIAEPCYKGAVVKITGNKYIGKNDKQITILVELEGTSSTTYTINLVRDEFQKIGFEFDYVNGEEVFTVPMSGTYRLETWGASGNVVNTLNTKVGYGGYSVGEVFLHKDTKLYINVGGQGVNTTKTNLLAPGGYNGGGAGKDYRDYRGAGSGGGATHIALSSGLLKNLATKKEDVLIVAGGGGGVGNYAGVFPTYKAYAGSGGGYTGATGYTQGTSYNYYGYGGTQTAAGSSTATSSVYSGVRGGFGYGGNCSSAPEGNCSGGGGGYYGGGFNTNYSGAGGGGSGYIGNELLTNKEMYCYNCTSSSNVNTKTLSTINYSENPISEYAKVGNGKVRITVLNTVSSDNYLDSIILNDGDVNIDFEPWNMEYSIHLPSDINELKVDAIPKDNLATIKGTGTFKISPYEETEINIIVTASDNTERIYKLKVTRDASNSPYPDDIQITNMLKTLCKEQATYCNYTFDKDTTLYEITVPYRMTSIDMEVILNSEYQKIKVENKDVVKTDTNFSFDLDPDINTILITVTSEDDSRDVTYTYKINRDSTGNNFLKDLKVVNPDIQFDFDMNTYEYFLNIDGHYNSYDLEYETDHPGASVVYSGNTNLKVGMNNCIITVTAPNGSTKVYLLHVYRSQDSNVFLSDLKVKNNDTLLELSPTFDKTLNDYTINVDNSVSSINIEATPESIDATVSGNTNYELKSGINIIQVKVIAADGKTENIYNINIYREKNSNPYLENIIIDGYTLDPVFDKETTDYFITIPKDVTKLDINVVPEEDTTTYKMSGNLNLIKAQNEIVITSIAEDKSFKVYHIFATKEVSNDNNLSSLKVFNDTNELTLNPEFSSNEVVYNLSVSNDVNSVRIEATLNDKYAKVTGDGIYYLQPGVNNIIVTVTSEAGDIKNYNITINREQNSDVTLKQVNNNQNSTVILSKYEETGYDYLINVQYEVNSIAIEGIPNANTSIVTGNGTYALKTGDNDITLNVTAEDGTNKNYIVRVVRDLSTNDDLGFLYVHEGGLTPNFNETIISYDVKIPFKYDSVTIEAEAEDKNALVSIIGDLTNIEVEVPRKVIVKVVAEKGKNLPEDEQTQYTKEYTLNIVRQQDTTNNLSLLSLETDRGDVNPTFDPTKLNYTLEVPNEITDITVTGIPFSDNVEVRGNGTYPLRVGKNLISIFVVGDDNIEQCYQIVVTRNKSSDATLSNVVVKGHTLNPRFNKDIKEYTLNTSASSLEFTTIKPTEDEATYEVIDNENFVTGENIVTIRVTAPDGKTTLDYVIKADKQASKNNNLKSLSIDGYDLSPNFHKAITFYSVNVLNNVNNVFVRAEAEDKSATITGIGLQTVKSGETFLEVMVTSEAGTTKTYTILITKDASENNYLQTLIPSAGYLNPEFMKNINDYTLEVENEIDRISFYGIPEDANATILGLEEQSLNIGENDITITVISESGLINLYNVKVVRKPLLSPYLIDLKVDGYELDTEFNKEQAEYYVNINNEVSTFELLNLNYIKEDESAVSQVIINDYSCSENKDCEPYDLELGINEIKIIITASDNSTMIYTLYVNRLMSTNNYLEYLEVNGYNITPEFNREILEYNLEVDRDIEKIIIKAEAEDKNATIISGSIGEKNLNPGLNTFDIKVRSSVGIVRTYKLNVIRKQSTNNYLASLNLYLGENKEEIVYEFNKEDNNYEFNIDYSPFISIKAEVEDKNASLVGDGVKELITGKNTFEIIVTAEDGSINTYTVVINNPASNNNYALNIVPSSGNLNPEFNKETDTYNLELEDVSSLSFDITLESSKASVTGHEIKPVDEGTSVRIITVTAEDGSTRDYTINITRPSKSEARLENLEIDGYPFEFNSDTFTYNIGVSKSKKMLLESEITAVPKDSEATINLMGDLNLVDGIVNIYVIEVIAKDGYTTQTYTLNITRDSAEYTLRSNKYEIVRFEDEAEEDYVIGIQPSTIISDFKNNFENSPEDLKVYLETSEVTDTELTATALVLKLEKNGRVYDTLRVIVRGDLTKDGKVNITDQVKMINYVGRTTTFDKYQMLAGDLTFDGKVNITDQVKIINYVGRTISDLNNKPTS